MINSIVKFKKDNDLIEGIVIDKIRVVTDGKYETSYQNHLGTGREYELNHISVSIDVYLVEDMRKRTLHYVNPYDLVEILSKAKIQ